MSHFSARISKFVLFIYMFQSWIATLLIPSEGIYYTQQVFAAINNTYIEYFNRFEITFPPISRLQCIPTLMAWGRRNEHIRFMLICLMLDNPFASWNINLWKYWYPCERCVCVFTVFVSSPPLNLLGLKQRGRRLGEEGVVLRRWGVDFCINNEGCRLFCDWR